MASNLIKYFGNSFPKLTVSNLPRHNYTFGSDWAEINKIVNQYDSEYLINFDLGSISKELWSLFRVPFKNVENLSIKLLTDTDGMEFNQLFPKLRDLRILFYNEVNYDIIDHVMPHLDHLDTKFSLWTSNKQKYLYGLVRKNPQIRSINTGFPLQFIKMVSQHLLNVENITLTF